MRLARMALKVSFVLPDVHDIVASTASRARQLPDKPLRSAGTGLRSTVSRLGTLWRLLSRDAGNCYDQCRFRSFDGVAPSTFIFRVGKCQNHCVVSFVDS